MYDEKTQFYAPEHPLVMIVGNYGSGKTEVSVNLSVKLHQSGKRVSIADLDIVNPYFRCREALELMEGYGIEVVTPPAAQRHADLPIVVPKLKGMLHPDKGCISLFDVGGDDVGATLLSSFFEALGDQPYCLLQVINSRRPFTDTVEGCLKMKDSIERASRLRVTGFVVNSHLIEETTEEVILEGVELARQVSERCGVPIEFVAAMREYAESEQIQQLGLPVLKLDRIMLPPWLQAEEKNDRSKAKLDVTPAEIVRPIFRP